MRDATTASSSQTWLVANYLSNILARSKLPQQYRYEITYLVKKTLFFAWRCSFSLSNVFSLYCAFRSLRNIWKKFRRLLPPFPLSPPQLVALEQRRQRLKEKGGEEAGGEGGEGGEKEGQLYDDFDENSGDELWRRNRAEERKR